MPVYGAFSCSTISCSTLGVHVIDRLIAAISGSPVLPVLPGTQAHYGRRRGIPRPYKIGSGETLAHHRYPDARRPVHQYHSHPVRRRGAERQFRPSRHAHGRGRHGLYAVDPIPETQSEGSRTGSTATVSCCRPATARCCFTACCTSPATTFRSTSSNASGSGAARRRDIPSAAIRRGGGRDRAAGAGFRATASAWRLRRLGWRRGTTGRATPSSIITPMRFAATAT